MPASSYLPAALLAVLSVVNKRYIISAIRHPCTYCTVYTSWTTSTCGFTETPFPFRACAIKKLNQNRQKFLDSPRFHTGIEAIRFMAVRREKLPNMLSLQGRAKTTEHLKREYSAKSEKFCAKFCMLMFTRVMSIIH